MRFERFVLIGARVISSNIALFYLRPVKKSKKYTLIYPIPNFNEISLNIGDFIDVSNEDVDANLGEFEKLLLTKPFMVYDEK